MRNDWGVMYAYRGGTFRLTVPPDEVTPQMRDIIKAQVAGETHMSRLWVDYTNHNGKRAWRQVAPKGLPVVEMYPPPEAKAPVKSELTYCIQVYMIDRGNALRTLALKSIHGFKEQMAMPEPVPAKPYTDTNIGKIAVAINDINNRGALLGQQIDSIDARLSSVMSGVSTACNGITMISDKVDVLGYSMDREVERDDIAAKMNALPKDVVSSGVGVGRFTHEPEAKAATGPDSKIKPPWECAVASDAMPKSTGSGAAVEDAVPAWGPFDLSPLRNANTSRQREWDTTTGGVSVLYRTVELAGEVGELCNKIKKLERERLEIKGTRTSLDVLIPEFGDVLITLDLLAARLGIDLTYATRVAFNDKSREHSFVTRLA